MDYRHLGRTGLKVSRLALGTMNFGEFTDEAPALKLSAEVMARLDEIWPGPGGEAPEAYA